MSYQELKKAGRPQLKTDAIMILVAIKNIIRYGHYSRVTKGAAFNQWYILLLISGDSYFNNIVHHCNHSLDKC